MSTIREFFLIFLYIFIVCTVSKVFCQKCVESGRWCLDDKACCGGCCRQNTCIDMYDSCQVYDDLCLNHVCPAGLICTVYQAECAGCGPVAECSEQ